MSQLFKEIILFFSDGDFLEEVTQTARILGKFDFMVLIANLRAQ